MAIDVISVGPGRQDLLTADAQNAILQSDVVFCAARHRKLVPQDLETLPLVPLTRALDEMEIRALKGQRVGVMVSGDSGLYSLLGQLSSRFAPEVLNVHPGISALSAFAAARGRLWQEARILSAHGRNLSPSFLCHTVSTNKDTILFLDAEHSPEWVRSCLNEGGLESARVYIGERLSYEDERVEEYKGGACAPLSMAWVENDAPVRGLPAPGIADDAFTRGKVPMTKCEIRVQILSMLALHEDSVVWDVGAGTGSVSVECARQCPAGEVYAVEKEADALELTAQNIRYFHILNVQVIAGEAPEAAAVLPTPTHVFIGGSGKRLPEIIGMLKSRETPVRVCVSAVTMETAHEALELMRNESGFEAVQIGVSRLAGIGTYTMFRAENPVFLMACTLNAGGAQ